MKQIVLAAAGFAMLFAVPALADDRDFDLTNATGYPIKTMLIDESASNVWGNNELDSILNDGSTVRVKFGKGDKGCKWDMKVTFTDDSSAEWHGFDLCTINSIILHYNRSTDVTSAEVQ